VLMIDAPVEMTLPVIVMEPVCPLVRVNPVLLKTYPFNTPVDIRNPVIPVGKVSVMFTPVDVSSQRFA